MADDPDRDVPGGSHRPGRVEGHVEQQVERDVEPDRRADRPRDVQDGDLVQPLTQPGSSVAARPGVRAGDPEDQAELRGLVQRVARGDEAAYEALYDRLSATVYGVCRRVLRDPAESEEVAQEVLLEVWRTASRYDPARAGVRSWVVMIAHSRAVDRVRSSERRRAREEATALPEPPAVDEVSEAAVSAFEVRRVRRAMAELSEVQQESVRLAFYAGHTHREVAALLGVPLGTVKTRIRDGLTRLRDQLGPDIGPGADDPPERAPARSTMTTTTQPGAAGRRWPHET